MNYQDLIDVQIKPTPDGTGFYVVLTEKRPCLVIDPEGAPHARVRPGFDNPLLFEFEVYPTCAHEGCAVPVVYAPQAGDSKLCAEHRHLQGMQGGTTR